MKNITQALNWRYATKKFDTTKKLSAEQLETLLESLRLTASSYGLQPWKFLVVENPELRTQIRGAAWDQSQVTEASHLIVLCAKTDVNEATVDEYMTSIAATRKMPIEALAGFSQMLKGAISGKSQAELTTWAAKQVYIALGTLLTTAALLEIDACPMEGFDPAAVNTILGLNTQNLTATVLCPVGLRDASDDMITRAKVRFPKEKVIEIR
jgi:nitroreductase